MFELAASGPAAARAALDRARRLAAEREAAWVDPFLGFAAGGIAFAAGDWDDAVAELDSALERAEETGTGWISLPVGFRSYIDAHRGRTGQARARLESFRHRGLPLQFGHDRPGWAELAVLEAEGATREAGTLARTLWSAARAHPGRWAADLAPDVTRVAVAGMDRRLAGQIGDDVAALCPPACPAWCTACSTPTRTRSRKRPPSSPEPAAWRPRRSPARNSPAPRPRPETGTAPPRPWTRPWPDTSGWAPSPTGTAPWRGRARWASAGAPGSRTVTPTSAGRALTATETRIAALVRDGLTNREIGTRLFVSPRTVQTHVSHILQKTGLRSRVEIARFAGT